MNTNEPTKPSAAPTHEWVCIKCDERGIPGTHVTFHERHDGCGGMCVAEPIAPSDAPTPETEANEFAIYRAHGPTEGSAVDSNFARRLERERDEARAELAKFKTPPPTEGSAVEWAEKRLFIQWDDDGNPQWYLYKTDALKLARRADEAEAQVKRYDGSHSSLIVEAEQLRGQLADEWDNARQSREEIEALKGDVAAMAENQGEWMRRAMAFEAQLAAAQAKIDQLNAANDALRAELLDTDKRRAAAQAEARELREALESAKADTLKNIDGMKKFLQTNSQYWNDHEPTLNWCINHVEQLAAALAKKEGDK